MTVSALQVADVIFTSSAAVANRMDAIDFSPVGWEVVGAEADFDSFGMDVGIVELGVKIIVH